MSDLPLVSAVVTTHNRNNLLVRALESVREQTYKNIELVLIDDGSTISAKNIADKYSDSMKVTFFRNEIAQGACAARNKGIELAAGDFVAGLDDDDEWMPERIETLMEAYSDTFAFVTSDVLQVFKKRQLIWKKDEIIDLSRLLFSNQVGNQGLIKKERLLAVDGFDESLVAAQDYDLWVRLCHKYGPIRNVTQPLQKVYMDHGAGQISNPRNQLRGYLQFYHKHKALMSLQQKKYQLFKIRKSTGKVSGLKDLFGWVPARFLWKEVKGLMLSRIT